ncbi:hypothetical protein L2E82_24490 [Cichorium intybus]|uniref:Uncharacterized protein n=1 Tax=Cichorium intybus TaxID=13427 RepID=A0ACB9E1W8_CICIN|nr:hypothetical protein L2E82_24490 [Cichorium intybus]
MVQSSRLEQKLKELYAYDDHTALAVTAIAFLAQLATTKDVKELIAYEITKKSGSSQVHDEMKKTINSMNVQEDSEPTFTSETLSAWKLTEVPHPTFTII